MENYYPTILSKNLDLNMYQCGTEKCSSGHIWGPAIRDHYLIHYILSGKGKFYVDNKEYILSKGQGFLICPDIVTVYEADKDDPWHYSWVGFHGLKAEAYLKSAGLTATSPIFTYNKDNYIEICLRDMMSSLKLNLSNNMKLTGLLYLFLSQLIEENSKGKFLDDSKDRYEIYVKHVLEYIEKNYSRNLSINEIASHLGLNRSYLGAVFRKKLSISIQEYLVDYRMNKACSLMHNKNLSIGDISRSVGYTDQLLFSKIFKKRKNASPKEYRNVITK